jgi:hypothetical protein
MSISSVGHLAAGAALAALALLVVADPAGAPAWISQTHV